MICKNPPAQSKERHGAVAAEFAIILIVLSVLMAGIFEINRSFMVKQLLTDACRSACRLATYQNVDNAALKTHIDSILAHNKNNYILPSTIKIEDVTMVTKVNGSSSDVKNAKEKDQVSVQLSLPYSKVKWMVNVQYLANDQIWAEEFVMMRQK